VDASGRLKAAYGADITGTLTASGAATLSSTLSLTGALTLGSYISLPEISAPSAATDKALLYAADANSRTNLYARMSDAIRPVTLGQAARVYNNANISINNATATALTFNSERFDNDSIHDTTNTGRLTCRTPGIYLITACVRFAANTTGDRIAYLRLNGSTQLASVSARAAASSSRPLDLVVTAIYSLVANDYVEVVVYQDSGAALNVLYAAAVSPEFAMCRIG
jgi:hypothetical protein